MKNSIFACFARAFFIFWHFADVLVPSTTWNDLFCSCVDDVSIWWQMFNYILLCPKCWFQFNSRIVRTHFSSIMSLNNGKMMAETRSHIFRWRSRFRRRRVCLSSLMLKRVAIVSNLKFELLKTYFLTFSARRQCEIFTFVVLTTTRAHSTKIFPFSLIWKPFVPFKESDTSCIS